MSARTDRAPGPVAVYNLTLDDDNAYYANGVLVRNCADALALTFAYPVAPPMTAVASTSRARAYDYDPHAAR